MMRSIGYKLDERKKKKESSTEAGRVVVLKLGGSIQAGGEHLQPTLTFNSIFNYPP